MSHHTPDLQAMLASFHSSRHRNTTTSSAPEFIRELMLPKRVNHVD